MKPVNQVSFGQMGNAITTAGAEFTAIPDGMTIIAVTPLTGVTGVTTVSANTDVWPSLSAAAIPVGATIYGSYTSVTSAGGPAMVYFG